MVENGAEDGIEGIELRRTRRNVHQLETSFKAQLFDSLVFVNLGIIEHDCDFRESTC